MAKKARQRSVPEHKTVTVSIKTAEVDELIVPVVEWLNGFADVQTYAACEGYDPDEVPTEQTIMESAYAQSLTLASRARLWTP